MMNSSRCPLFIDLLEEYLNIKWKIIIILVITNAKRNSENAVMKDLFN